MAKKGSAEERDLVHKLWERNFAAMRAPASGGATKRPLPDWLEMARFIWLLKLKRLPRKKSILKRSKLLRFVSFQKYLVQSHISESGLNILNGYF